MITLVSRVPLALMKREKRARKRQRGAASPALHLGGGSRGLPTGRLSGLGAPWLRQSLQRRLESPSRLRVLSPGGPGWWFF